MVWTSERVRDLRMSLGCSQADLARRLQVSLETIQDWEGGCELPSSKTIDQLQSLEVQVGISLDHLRMTPLAEFAMKDLGLNQIDSETLSARDIEIS